ncbi:MAG: acyl-ACP--UDP-N-acetylglucosamine O-acyltransferase [Sulfurospirillum sp.]|nr:acyl-ACP--UDP-N-acetylglucosamine O-acyltransferase [Sulfurospirillum sp.]
MTNIHPSAIIENRANIADNVKIGAFTFISKKAILKSGVEVMHGAQIYGDTTIGENTKIYPYAVIGIAPQARDLTKEDNVKVIIGKNSIIREFVTINEGTSNGGGITRIGNNCLIMVYCHIAHDCQIGNNVTMANNAILAGHVEIGKFAVIGGMTPVHQFVKIGEGCMIGGGSAVSQDIPPFCLAEGNRASIKGLNIIGLKRRFQNEDIHALRVAFKELFRSKKALKDVVDELMSSQNNKKVLKMCSFIKATKRGIPYKRKK